MQDSRYFRATQAIRWATIGVLLGRAYQYFFWDAPYRSFFFQEEWIAPIAQQWGYTWSAVVENLQYDRAIQYFIYSLGGLYVLTAVAVAALPLARLKRVQYGLLIFSALNLFLLSVLYMKENFYSWAQLIEYAAQWGAPMLYAWLLKDGDWSAQLATAGRVLVSATFVGHGLYALGVYPIPVEYLTMTMNILQCGEAAARTFLYTAGIIDMVAVLLLWLPFVWAHRMGLAWCVGWGLATALARGVSNWQFATDIGPFLHQYGFEMVYRVPHFLLPLALYFYSLRPTQRDVVHDFLK